MDYEPLNQRSRQAWKRTAIGTVGLFLICMGLHSLSIYGSIGGLLIACSALLKKEMMVCESGLSMTYDVVFYRYREDWKFCEIDCIHKEYARDGDRVMLHFSKGVMTRKLLFSRESAEEIIRMAKQKNSKIYVDTAH